MNADNNGQGQGNNGQANANEYVCPWWIAL